MFGKMIDGAKKVWKDNSGASESIQIVGYAIAALSLAGIIAAIGITATKNMAAGTAADIGGFNVDASAIDGTNASTDSFTITDGQRGVSGVTLSD